MISFFVPGIPKPQGSKRAIVNRYSGKPALIEAGGAALGDWRGDVKALAMQAMGDTEPLDGPIVLTLEFCFSKPKSAPKSKPVWPVKRSTGDIDKQARSVLDALTSVCFRDDAQVVELYAFKRWSAKPGVHVELKRLQEIAKETA